MKVNLVCLFLSKMPFCSSSVILQRGEDVTNMDLYFLIAMQK